MEKGTIVRMKPGSLNPIHDLIIRLEMSILGFKSFPEEGQEYQIQACETYKCPNCDEDHVKVGIDNVGNEMPFFPAEWFEVVGEANNVDIETLMNNSNLF